MTSAPEQQNSETTLDLKDPFNDRGFLDDTQKEFSQSLRWGAIEKAATFVVPEQRAE